jgi:signal transduction histidine kinase
MIDEMTASLHSEGRSFRQLWWAALGGLFLLPLAVELARLLLMPALAPGVASLVVLAVGLVALAVFYHQVFGRLEKLERRLNRQNSKLLELHAASLVVTADLSLDTVLQTVVERARALLGTRYGAISVIDQDGAISSFVTSGIEDKIQHAIGDPPHGRGLLGVALHEGQRLRLDDISRDPRSVGFPSGHPPMRSLLAVPVVCRVPHRGNLYVSEKEDGSFTAEDEEALARFAEQAAIAIDNAYLYAQVRELGAARERLRIAHEMHDGLAQVLAYVNTQAQVVREYLRQGKTQEAQEHLAEFAEAARHLYADVRQQILELRSVHPEEAGVVAAIADFVKGWRQQTGIEAELDLPATIDLPAEARRQVVRIVQEALGNVRKHARASHVRIVLEDGPDGPLLVVGDDGIGFDTAAIRSDPAGRYGLDTMAERAAAVGAKLAVHSQPGHGTRVEIGLPGRTLRRKESEDAAAPGG